jgi:hypothetical protein
MRVVIKAEGHFQSTVAIFVNLIEICGYSLIKHCMYPTMPVLVAARSKVWVCSHSLAEIVGSNPAGGHRCLSVTSVACRQVEVFVTSPRDCGVSFCVI